MKKVLLTLLSSCALVSGYSQVVLNEIYVDPATNKQHSEFFELYNTSILATPINLDCYTLISYKTTGSGNKTLFVIDIPNLGINPKSYFVGAASSPLDVQNKTNQPLNFNWSDDANLTANGGSIKKYVLNTAGTSYTVSNLSAAEKQDIFFTNSGVTNYGVFLFNNGVYVNGFIGGYSSATPPSEITSLPAITGLTNACGTYSINWSTVTKNEFVGSASGTDNGYIRNGDGLCGTWVKASNNHTPGVANPGSTSSTSASTLTTTQKLICGNRLDFTITAPTFGVAFPVEVQLYIDKNKDSKLDVSDVFVSSYPSAITGGSTTVYSFNSLQVLASTEQYLLVYKTALGCFDKLVVPTIATGSLSTTTKDVCGSGSQIDFTVSGATGDLSSYALPITVEMHYDLNGNKVLDAEDMPIIDTKPITSFSSTIQTFTNPDPTKKVILVYKTAQSCFDKTEAATPTTGALSTTQTYFCNKRVDFTVSGGTLDAPIYSLPVVVSIYHDVNGDGILNENTSDPNILLGQKTITAYSATTTSIDLAEANWGKKPVIIEYKAAKSCFSKTITASVASTGAVTVDGNMLYNSTTNKSTLNYSIVTGSTAADAYPLQLNVYEDVNLNKQIDGGESIIATQNVNTTPPTGTTYSVDLITAKSNAIIVAKSTIGCSQSQAAIVNTVVPLPVKLINFNAKRHKEKVLLTWETTMELNNSGFDIQRKLGNGEWKNVAFVFSQANSGNSNRVLTYEYDDVNTAKGISQYRLRQVDIDTRYTLSEIRSVHGLEQANKVMVYPNPSTEGTVNIIFDDQRSSRTVKVSDISGRIIKQYGKITDSSLQINNLQNGVYTIQITNNSTGEVSIEKVIVKKR